MHLVSKYRAFVDVFDIVSYILNVLEKVKERHDIKTPTDHTHTVISHELAELDIPIGEAMSMYRLSPSNTHYFSS